MKSPHSKLLRIVTQIHGRNTLRYHIPHKNIKMCPLFKIRITCCKLLVFTEVINVKLNVYISFQGELHTCFYHNHYNIRSNSLHEKVQIQCDMCRKSQHNSRL